MISPAAIALAELLPMVPGLTPDALERMPYVRLLQLRAMAWARTPGITPVVPGASWTEDAINRIAGLN
ncbi:MAG: hypothetical protein ACO3LT_09335 [Ilumatobacteraceae bacterium]